MVKKFLGLAASLVTAAAILIVSGQSQNVPVDAATLYPLLVRVYQTTPIPSPWPSAANTYAPVLSLSPAPDPNSLLVILVVADDFSSGASQPTADPVITVSASPVPSTLYTAAPTASPCAIRSSVYAGYESVTAASLPSSITASVYAVSGASATWVQAHVMVLEFVNVAASPIASSTSILGGTCYGTESAESFTGPTVPLGDTGIHILWSVPDSATVADLAGIGVFPNPTASPAIAQVAVMGPESFSGTGTYEPGNYVVVYEGGQLPGSAYKSTIGLMSNSVLLSTGEFMSGTIVIAGGTLGGSGSAFGAGFVALDLTPGSEWMNYVTSQV